VGNEAGTQPRIAQAAIDTLENIVGSVQHLLSPLWLLSRGVERTIGEVGPPQLRQIADRLRDG
jgi:hypothetical protein